MEIVSPFYLYLILQLDSIKDLLAIAGSLGVLFGGSATLFLTSYVNSELGWKARESSIYDGDEAVEAAKKGRRYGVKFASVGLIALFFNAFLPTSERMAILVVLPAVANNEAVQTEAKEVYDLAKRGLAKLIEERAEEPAK